MNWSLGLAAIALLSLVTAAPFPLKVHKSGEERVKDTVSKAEAAASKAAQERLKHGHKAESRIPADKEKHAKEELEKLEHDSKVASQLLSLDSSGVKEPNTKRVQEGSLFHVRHHYANKFHPKSHFGGPQHQMGVTRKLGIHHKSHGGLFDFGDMSSNSNSPRAYSEDTGLEDRLAMEAEESKKYESGGNYGGWGGGGGGGGATGKSGISSWDLQSNIQKQDAAEKQSIQAQVAAESTHELEEIQREIAQESQTSRGATTVGGGGSASVGQEAPPMKGMGGMERMGGMGRMGGPGGMGGMSNSFAPQMSDFQQPQQKSYGGMMDENSEISRMVKQAEKLSPGEMNAPNIGNYGMGSPPQHGALDASKLAAAFSGQQGGMMGGQEAGQQGGFQEQTAAFQGGQEQGGYQGYQGGEQEQMGEEQPAQGGMEQAMAQGGQYQGMGGMEQGGMGMQQPEQMAPGMGAASMMQGMQGMQGMQEMQGMQGMQGMRENAASFAGGQQESPYGGSEFRGGGGGGGGMPDFGQQMMQQPGSYKKSTVPHRPATESRTHYNKKSHHMAHKKDVKKPTKSKKTRQSRRSKTHQKHALKNKN